MSFSTVTSETNEINFRKLFHDLRRISIPLFQRRYVWKKKNFDQLTEDIEAIEDGQDPARFLGTVVAVARQGSLGDFEEVEIVDGQQRTISIYLFLCAVAESACQLKEYKFAAKLVTTSIIFKDKDLEHTTRIYPSLEDRHEFASVLKYLWDDKQLTEELSPFEIRPPATTGVEPPESRQEMLSQYFRIRRYIQSTIKDKDAPAALEVLQRLSDIVTTNLTFVSLTLRDPASAPLIFQSLNEKGVKTTIGDLVRNEIFSKVFDDPAKAKSVYTKQWQPFIQKFRGSFDDYLFPYCLTINHTIPKTDCFQELRSSWKAITDPAAIIKELDAFSGIFIALEHKTAGEIKSEGIKRALLNFSYSNAPSSVYPFVFQAVRTCLDGECDEQELLKTLDIVESFLVRRAICGVEPTGLHAVFKSLWSDLDKAVDSKATRKKLLSIKTQVWPGDSEVMNAILTKPLYTSRIVKFLLMELEKSLEADVTEPDFEIEHILPQTLTSDWKKQGFDEDGHKSTKDLLANLVPLSEGLNKKVSQSLFHKKKPEYTKKSKFALARTVAHSYETWTPTDLERRGTEIAKWAVTRWPIST